MPSAKSISLSAFLAVVVASSAFAQWLLVPMDNTQTNHLKAYGLTYWTLQTPREYKAMWLLNYRAAPSC